MSETTYEKTSTRTETTFHLHGAPDVKVRHTSITIRPDRAIVTDNDGVVVKVELRGDRVLKSGLTSNLSRHDTAWFGFGATWLDGAPEFVRDLVREVERRA